VEHQYSVYGYWAETGERWFETYQATSPRSAEDLAAMDAAEKGGTLRVARVVEGEHRPVDLYTAFVDPADPHNDGIPELVPDVPDITAGDPEWTVFGLAAPAGTVLGDPDVALKGERYGDVVNAASPLAAEDVARDRVLERGGVLFVCTVLAGRVAACDTYAVFADPDVESEQ
jgi:hypothetical protein